MMMILLLLKSFRMGLMTMEATILEVTTLGKLPKHVPHVMAVRIAQHVTELARAVKHVTAAGSIVNLAIQQVNVIHAMEQANVFVVMA